MADANTNPSFSQHYLTVQALTPTTTAETQSTPLSTNPIQTLSFSILILTAVLMVVAVTLIATKFRNRSFIGGSLKIGFILALIPFSLGLVKLQTQLTSQADANLIPTDLVISDVTATSLSVTFTTKAPTLTAVTISTNPEMGSVVSTKSSPPQQPQASHQFTFQNLDPDTTYYLQVLANGTWYNDAGQPLRVQTTSE